MDIMLRPFLVLLLLGGTALLVFVLAAPAPVWGMVAVVFAYQAVSMASEVMDAHRNMDTYRRTARAVADNGITQAWVARDTTCNGILVVDPGRRMIVVNGMPYGFEQIHSTSCQGTMIELNVGDGDDPVQHVEMENAAEAENAATRLINAVGMTPL